jgi:hypothetical protein
MIEFDYYQTSFWLNSETFYTLFDMSVIMFENVRPNEEILKIY